MNSVGDATVPWETPTNIGEILECSVPDPTEKVRSLRYDLSLK